MTARNPPKRRASSRERIERILDATETLLGEQGLTELSMYAIAEQAQIPPSSVYHFFPQVGDVLSALAERVFVELDALLQEQAELAHEGGWPALVERIEARFQSYYQANPAASELLLGAHELAAVRQADRQHDLQLGQRFRECLETRYRLPHLPHEVDIFTLALQAADKLLAVDYQQHGRLTPPMCREATRLVIGYLGVYLPVVLPPVEAP
ncbi:transcriptional regulator, TetR family [Halopseudomonas xinjiangensis]|uniref:Transcriptional regulator, TetR family n=1 Tax=Halopseudomonas xinjiangensis TaxID=487184 RepID=A0A1H1YI07_9GAMM|nr:TetR/AcrR family transcriptional regulator [Halopseudomonas xinjiangensis]SDT21014.1 transcriptional regulator, TetR family [Halopseudomonas xinjiangensis]